jgi:polysaccharide export outer membrane protein
MRKSVFLASCAATIAALGCGSFAQAQDYQLEPGDILDFAIVGAPNFTQKVPVSSDGSIRLPIGGQFQAGGRSIDELRGDVVDKLKTSSYPAGVDAQGNTTWNVVYPEGVILGVAEYRPIYLSGDVLTPGAQSFRFGMTVRQAAAVAGGYSMFRNRQDYTLEAAGSEEEYRGVLTQFAKAQMKAARIQAELDGTQPDFSKVETAGVDPAMVTQFEGLERQQFDSRLADRQKERENIAEGIKNAEARYSYLEQSKRNLENETKNYEEELRRVEELLRKGLTQVARLNDAQRAVFLVATRSLETSAEVARIERELVELKRSLEKVDTQSGMDNLSDLQDTTITVSNLRAQIEKLGRRQQLFAPSLLTGAGNGKPRIAITRREGDRYVQIDGNEDTTLQPGDTVEVSLGSADRAASAAPGGSLAASTIGETAPAR